MAATWSLSDRAIVTAAPDAKVTFFPLRAGHFGLVVGSRAMSTTWPTVADWLHYQNGTGPKPRFLATKEAPEPEDDPEIRSVMELILLQAGLSLSMLARQRETTQQNGEPAARRPQHPAAF